MINNVTQRLNLFSPLLIALLLLLSSCGNRRSPTGGPEDHTLPEIIYTIPVEYEQIENNEIVIAFSKVMDRTSVINGLIVSPTLLNKRLSWKRNSLHILFTEELPADTNIIVYLNKSTRCERGKTFADHAILTFRNGELQRNSLSGYIILTPSVADTWAQNIDLNYTETQIALLDRDSLLIFNNTIVGDSYSFDTLNPDFYTMRAFIDINANNRYDFGIDPFYRASFELPTKDLININLTVADTVRPNLNSLSSPANNQMILNFNKTLAQIPFVSIVEDSTGNAIEIFHKELAETQLFLKTAAMDTLRYIISIEGLIDHRGNERQYVSTYIDSNGLPDTISPGVLNTFPRNGGVIDNSLPEITVSFNKILFRNDVMITMHEVESGQNIPLTSLNIAGFTMLYRPQRELREFSSYQIIIHEKTSDLAGNILGEDFVVQFIVIGG